MVRMPNIQARRSSLSSSTSTLSSTATAALTATTKRNLKRKNVNKILCCFSRDYASYSCSSCCESSSETLCSFFVNSIFRSFTNKQKNMKRSTARRHRRRRRKLLLLETKTIGKSKTVGIDNKSSRIINTTSTSSFSSGIVQPVNSQSTTYPLCSFPYQYQSSGFDFERFR